MRKLIWDATESELGDALHAERLAQRTAGRTADFGEGVKAFLEKRAANFQESNLRFMTVTHRPLRMG